MESELFCEDYWVPDWWVTDPGDEVESIKESNKPKINIV